MTSAEAQAFKRACSCFGLGRYFYDFAEMWVELNENKQPKSVPSLPAWALPKSHTSTKLFLSTKLGPTLPVNSGPTLE